jgi:phosphoglycolate phosphatase-like HAD superfamily hydrolase
LGGFGSDYCSNDIEDFERNHLDRAEQIAIAVRRASELYPDETLRRVVHVGDAPADVLAARACAEGSLLGHLPDLCVGMVAVATGSYTGKELRELAGDSLAGRWEPVVLEDGMADESFISACGL